MTELEKRDPGTNNTSCGPQDETVSHANVLRGLKQLSVPGYEMLVEENGSQLALPNALFQANSKPLGQRKRNLCYVDSILHACRAPRIIIEVVDSNPGTPNGITGLTINVDRIAKEHPNIDLIFIVLAEMKTFYCSR